VVERNLALWKCPVNPPAYNAARPKRLPRMPKNTPKTDSPMAFEAALAELETIANRMEEGAASMDAMLADYHRAVQLLGQCRGQLQAVEDQVKVIDASLPQLDGEPQ
jgi:exodeoxyribonuclease VII small subunit